MPTFNVAPYIPKYVRALHTRNETVPIPYTQTQFGVVLMVDVVGFSALTTLAMERGGSSAESLALEIGAYLGECIQVIEFYDGDVVKFLGDAVLVCFQSTNPVVTSNTEASGTTAQESEDKSYESVQRHVLVRKAVECGIQLLARLSRYRVYLTAEERFRHRTMSNADDLALQGVQGQWYTHNSNDRSHSARSPPPNPIVKKPSVAIPTPPPRFNVMKMLRNLPLFRSERLRDEKRRPSTESDQSMFQRINAVDLELHLALSCGDVTNIIIGDPDTEGIAKMRNRTSVFDPVGPADLFLLNYYGRLEYTVGGPVVQSLDKALPAARAQEMCITPEAFKIMQQQHMNIATEVRDGYHIVKRKDYTTGSSLYANMKHSLTSGVSFEMTKPSDTEVLIPRIRNKSLLNISVDSNPYFIKYLNRSSLYRLGNSVDGTYPAHYRDVTIMFVSLGNLRVDLPEGLSIAQNATYTLIKLLVQYEGTLQQFAIDDKGATLLATFGLPPLSHEREAIYAAKAAIDLYSKYKKLNINDFAIALSTGTIFNGILPENNPFRRDGSIAGDAIIQAVRMLKFPFSKRQIVCDVMTRQQIGSLCIFDDLGENYVKGKVKPIQLYYLQGFNDAKSKQKIRHNSYAGGRVVGYNSEMIDAISFIDDWLDIKNNHVLIVSGPSGVGKTFFCNQFCKNISQRNVEYCWASCAEGDRSINYRMLRTLMIALFELIDSDNIPRCEMDTDFSSEASPDTQSSGISSPLVTNRMSGTGSTSFSERSSVEVFQLHSLHSKRSSGERSLVDRSSKQITPGDLFVGNETANFVSRCLQKCGEGHECLPLFKTVFSSLNDVADNQFTRRLNGRARDSLLTGVITRMIRYVSDHVHLALICNDMQWVDSASARMIQYIHEKCDKAILIFTTRPTWGYNIKLIDVLRSGGTCEEIKLNGLKDQEIGEVIIKNFEGAIDSVSPALLRVVQKQTGGNPLYVKNMALYLKHFEHVSIVKGELVPNVTEHNLAGYLDNYDNKRSIKMQFDRLNFNFQEFLIVACFLDDYFALNEVGAVIKYNNKIFASHDTNTAHLLIKKYDAYKFLVRVDNSNSLESIPDTYTFTHSTIPHSIYGIVTYDTRMVLHKSLAKYYESQLSADNCEILIAKVTKHYLETDCIEKQLYYLELLANVNMRTYMLPEATTNLEKMVVILEENPEYRRLFGRVHLGNIYRRLGVCYTMRTRFDLGETYLFKALRCMGEPWPKNGSYFFVKYWGNRAKQYIHRYFGERCRAPIKSEHKREVYQRIVEIMAQLSEIYFYTGNGRDFFYSCMVGLNICEHLGHVEKYHTVFLARNALLYWLKNDKDGSVYYITGALKLMGTNIDTSTLIICGLLCFAAGKFTNARQLLYQSVRSSKTMGFVTDCQAFYRSVEILIAMRIFEGNLNNSPQELSLLRQMAETAQANDDSEATIWISVYHVSNGIIVNRLRECKTYVAALESRANHTPIYNRVAIHGTLLGYYARIKSFNRARYHEDKLVAVLPSLMSTPNIFPIFGLIFATMGIYSMIEDYGYWHSMIPDSDDYKRFITSVTQLNQGFQVIKLWELAIPCIYLARALPYIGTKRTVEGYTILHHGIYKMNFMQEIRFLKAYYMSCLGKYAFIPSDRMQWTEQAKHDLLELNISPDVYCNPDPANYYARGLLADLTSSD